MNLISRSAGFSFRRAGQALGVALLIAASPAAARSLLHGMFQDHAVLQRDVPVPVWGKAAPGARVTVSLDGMQATARAGRDGGWRIMLPRHTAGGPYRLEAAASTGERQQIDDVMIGDVWLCSGQSNMEFELRKTANADAEIAGVGDPKVRLLSIARESSPAPRYDFATLPVWQPATPQSARDFSAACWFMARNLRAAEDVPIGLIGASWGGSIIEDWLGRQSLARLGGFDAGLRLLDLYARDPAVAWADWSDQTEKWMATRSDLRLAQADLDDSGWSNIAPDSFWESWRVPELAGFDGILWLRKSFEIAPGQAGQPATLALGPIDDTDTVWVNGRQIGSSSGWTMPRSYAVPPGVLVAGRNVIAVRVLDTGGGGGFHGDPAQRRLSFADGPSVPLGGEWRYRIDRPLAGLGTPPRVSWQGASGFTTLSNGMIAPLGSYAMKGFAWYQGESNVGDPDAYRRLLSALIRDWRDRFGGKSFLIVQLAGFGPRATVPGVSSWAALREVQRTIAGADPETALATAIDVGDPYDIHPTNKQEVGRRLALAAQALAARSGGERAGPWPFVAERRGADVVVRFDRFTGPLRAYGAAGPIGFEACTFGRTCRFTEARIEGNDVVLPGAADAASIRYLWADSPVINLFDGDDLPALPFELRVD